MIKRVDLGKVDHQLTRVLNERSTQFIGILLWKLRKALGGMSVTITMQDMQDFMLAFCKQGTPSVAASGTVERIRLSLADRDGVDVVLDEPAEPVEITAQEIQLLIDYHENQASSAEAIDMLEAMHGHEARIKHFTDKLAALK